MASGLYLVDETPIYKKFGRWSGDGGRLFSDDTVIISLCVSWAGGCDCAGAARGTSRP